MAFNYKNKEQLVNDVIETLKTKLPINVDYSDGEPLRTIIEAIMQELDLQYWQMEQVYNSGFLETAIGEDLDKLVKILGVTRINGAKSVGNVIFSRITPAAESYFIEAGTLLSTKPNNDGVIFQFETLENAVLEAGEVAIEVPIASIETGVVYNVTAQTITVINTPPIGIESVINNVGMNGGYDIESDEQLRKRAETKLESSGLGTVQALSYFLSNIPLIQKVQVYDMYRGIGTVDIVILGESVPMDAAKFQECLDIVEKTRAAGIDVLAYEPTIKNVDLDVVLTMEDRFQVETFTPEVIKVIDDYINSLNAGESLIKNQLERKILNISDRIDDVEITTVSGNIPVLYNEVIRTQNIIVR